MYNECRETSISFIIQSIFNIKSSWLQLFRDIPSKTEYFTLENGDKKIEKIVKVH